MYLVLFGVGLLVTAAGFVTIGFGIPINAFSLGNTLIISGTTAVVGGFLLLGIAAAIRQLNRISVALGKGLVTRPVAAPAPAPAAMPVPVPPQVHAPTPVQAQVQAPVLAPAETASDSLVPPTARLPQAPVRSAAPPPPKAPEPVAPRAEPRFPAASGEPSSGPLDWLRSKSKSDVPPAAPEAPMMEVPDEAPLSPRTPPRAFTPSAAPSEQPPEPKVWMPSRSESSEAPAKEPRVEFPPMTSPRAERVQRAAAPVEPARDPGRGGGGKDAGLFDVVWPDVRAKQPAEPAPPRAELRPEPPARPREEPRAERQAAILKSGVIDGMGYTLYADGSIEAELPQGTVRFASVDALRAHLEKSS